ncbi:MAG: orc1/cdc6 family replication initiation protein [Acidilobaceae archaeon]|nr:orc1/cdc6 family replication initiation protein [Acidilobaceae archaeon]
MDSLEEIFRRALKSKIFRNREKLLPDYVPEALPHREEEIRKIASVLAPSLRGEKPSNLFIYGLTGTGKTAVVRYVLSRLEASARESGQRVRAIYVNARYRDTPYRVLADIGEGVGVSIPFTGLSTGEIFARIVKKASDAGVIYIVVLDEIDFLVKRRGDDVLYKLTRINGELRSSKVSLIGITNSVDFIESLDPRVKSSLGEVELVFPPYNAEQLKDILSMRAREAFQPGALEEDVIPLCAALAAREHGDARRALDLLRVAGELAERGGAERVRKEHVMKAREEIERDRVVEVIRTLPLHGKLVLLAVISTTAGGRTHTTTGEVYDKYKLLTRRLSLETVTLRRVSGILAELDMLGVISGRVISKGRYGKTRVIELSADLSALLRALSEDITIGELTEEVGREALGKRDSLRRREGEEGR